MDSPAPARKPEELPGLAAGSCRKCGACCIALSISSPIPGMPAGKPAGVRCVNLLEDNSCRVYAGRPVVCRNHRPSDETCGGNFEDAMARLRLLEELTAS